MDTKRSIVSCGMNKPDFIDESLMSRAIYATDASIYQFFPEGIAYPKNVSDIKKILDYAKDNNLSITCRGRGTSLAGQTIGKGIIIDFSKYMNQILEIDAKARKVNVQPGVVRDQLNKAIAKYHLHFAPDPATSSRATIGGMIANNSSGTKSILYGITTDHVLSLKVMLYDGSVIQCHDMSPDQVDEKSKLDTIEGALYRALLHISENHSEDIQRAFPSIMRRVSGYALDRFKKGHTWNLAHLFCGSEGTLGIILEATLNLTPLPNEKELCVLHYTNRHLAIKDVQHLVKSTPAAVEMCDWFVLEQCKENLSTKPLFDDYILDTTDTILIVEYYGHSHIEIEENIEKLLDILQGIQSEAIVKRYQDAKVMNDIWNIRKKGLGLLMGKKTKAKPIAFIEDSSIPLEHLSAYIDTIQKSCEQLQVPVVIYAHASVGVLHIRPILDLTIDEDIEKMKTLSNIAFDEVKKYRGSWSGEHGDGRVRGPFLQRYFGDKVYSFFIKIKSILDPSQIFNPNVLLTSTDIGENLRLGTSYEINEFPTLFQYREERSFQDIVHNCSGIGACVKQEGGVMCPSFRATQEESDSTRGRANVLRLAMSGQLDKEQLSSPIVKDVLKNCLSCKACKSECPSNVDMAKLKSEILQLNYDKSGVPLAIKMAGNLELLGKLGSGLFSRPTQLMSGNVLFKKAQMTVLGMSPQRNLPSFAKSKFTNTFKKIDQPTGKVVGLYADCYTRFYENELGASTLKLLNRLGYQVELLDYGCCQRPAISNGLLRKAKDKTEQVLEQLSNYVHDVIVLEPSCHSALLVDAPDLRSTETRTNHLYSLSSFLIKENIQIPIVENHQETVLIHGHCHEKALFGSKDIAMILTKFGLNPILLDTSCCGMAGAFGYQEDTYEISVQVAKMSLLPALEQYPNSPIVATGYSCRHQIKDLTDRVAYHWVDFIADHFD